MIVLMGFFLVVVVELDDLIVGGFINGYGIEGSFYIYGFFVDICVVYEIILVDGWFVCVIVDNEFKDLFYVILWL